MVAHRHRVDGVVGVQVADHQVALGRNRVRARRHHQLGADHLVARRDLKNVVAAARRDQLRQVAGRARQRDRIGASAAGDRLRIADRNRVAAGVEDQRIVAGAAVKRIATSGDARQRDRVVVGAAGDNVVERRQRDRLGAGNGDRVGLRRRRALDEGRRHRVERRRGVAGEVDFHVHQAVAVEVDFEDTADHAGFGVGIVGTEGGAGGNVVDGSLGQCIEPDDIRRRIEIGNRVAGRRADGGIANVVVDEDIGVGAAGQIIRAVAAVEGVGAVLAL